MSFTSATTTLCVLLLSSFLICWRIFGIRKIVLAFLSAYRKFQLLRLWLAGTTEDGESARRLREGKVWEEYCDTLKAAGTAIIASGTPKDAQTQAEGYRYLSRLVRVGLEAFVECNDVRNPVITSLANGSRAARVCIGSDNPDNLYQQAMISSQYEYKVSGVRGSVHYLGFGTQAGSYGKPGGLRTVDYREAGELVFDNKLTVGSMSESSRFELTLSARPPPRGERGSNWLRLDPSVGPHVFIIRQTFMRRGVETPACLQIKRREPTFGRGGEEGKHRSEGPSESEGPAGGITPNQLEEGLRTAGMFAAAAPLLFVRWANGFQKHVNALPLFDQAVSDAAGGDPNIRYFHSAWRLGPEEALVVDAFPPDCDTWNFQLNNFWMESLDYRYHAVHTNKALATYRAGGSGDVRIVVTHMPCVSPDRSAGALANGNFNASGGGMTWLTTAGHEQGTMCFRWVRPRDRQGKIFSPGDPMLPLPKARVVVLRDFLAAQNTRK